MTSIADICNRALLSIGARAQVSSITPSDGSTEADACAVLFTPTFESLARVAQWNCLRNQAALSLIQAAKGTTANPDGTTLPLPAMPWLYGYSIPADCLNVRWLIPNTSDVSGAAVPQTTATYTSGLCINGVSGVPFSVAYGTDPGGNPIKILLTNLQQAQCVYTVSQQNPDLWDSMFQEAMTASLAAYLVPALSLHVQLMQIQINRAEKFIIKARTADGDEGITVMDHTPDWIVARGGLGRSQFWSDAWTSNGTLSMVWP